MKPGLQVDTKQFNAALRQAVKMSKRSMVEVVNGQALALAKRALDATKKADSNRIRHEMGQVGTKLRKDRKTGRFKKGAAVFKKNDTLAHRIVLARYKKENKPIPKQSQLDQLARRERGRRIRSAGFIKSGWIPAIQTLFSRVKGKDVRPVKKRITRGGATLKGRPKGYALPAIDGPSVASATVANSAILPKSRYSSRTGNPMKYAEAGLRAAIAESVSDMRRHVEEKVRRISRKVSARGF